MSTNATNVEHSRPVGTRESLSLEESYCNRLSDLSSKFYDAGEEYRADDQYELRDQLDALLGDAIGAGSGRLVYNLPSDAYSGGCYREYVVKVGTYNSTSIRDGVTQNKYEAELWNEHAPYDFIQCPEFDSDYHWVIQPKGTTEFDQDTTYYEWCAQIEGEYCHLTEVEDIRYENVVMLDGEYRLCDYGAPGTNRF